jgi:acetyl esterase/lipase
MEDFLLTRPLYYRIFLAITLLSLSTAIPMRGQGQQPVAPPPGVELTPSGDGLKVVHIKESFSTLSLEGSDLRPQPPMSTDHERNADFERELVRLQWRPGDPIDMYVIRPPKAKNPPVVLYLYGFPNDLGRFRDNRFCQRVVVNGAAAVGFVSARTGYRAEHGPMKLWFISELPESLATTVHDVQLILNYLATRGDLDMSRVGMFGQGSGAAIAILAAATDARLRAIDLLNPWGDWPDWLAESRVVPKAERDLYVKPDFLKQVEPLEPVRYLPKLGSLPIRIQFFDDENVQTKQAVSKLEAAAPPTAKIVHYPNGRAMYAVSSEGRLFEWIANSLKSPAEAKQATGATPPAATAP